jgi:predicted component of type VI protein secretion system
MGQGRENVKKFLGENRDMRDRIADLVREKTGLKKIREEVEKEEPEKSSK